MQVSTTLNAARKPTRRATFAMRSRETEKLIMSPSMNMARNELALAMGSVNATSSAGRRTPAADSRMISRYVSNGRLENRRFATKRTGCWMRSPPAIRPVSA